MAVAQNGRLLKQFTVINYGRDDAAALDDVTADDDDVTPAPGRRPSHLRLASPAASRGGPRWPPTFSVEDELKRPALRQVSAAVSQSIVTVALWRYRKIIHSHTHTHTHTHLFNGPLSRTTRVSRYQKGKPIWISLKQETMSGSGICWAICKSAPRSRQIITPAPHYSVFYRPDALPAAQPTASKH